MAHQNFHGSTTSEIRKISPLLVILKKSAINDYTVSTAVEFLLSHALDRLGFSLKISRQEEDRRV
jgi:hypothetical protein